MDKVRLPKVGDWVTRTDFGNRGTFYEVIEVIIDTSRHGGGYVVLDQGTGIGRMKYHYMSHFSVGETWLFRTPIKGGFAKWFQTSK